MRKPEGTAIFPQRVRGLRLRQGALGIGPVRAAQTSLSPQTRGGFLGGTYICVFCPMRNLTFGGPHFSATGLRTETTPRRNPTSNMKVSRSNVKFLLGSSPTLHNSSYQTLSSRPLVFLAHLPLLLHSAKPPSTTASTQLVVHERSLLLKLLALLFQALCLTSSVSIRSRVCFRPNNLKKTYFSPDQTTPWPHPLPLPLRQPGPNSI